jgi:hypothetical protein
MPNLKLSERIDNLMKDSSGSGGLKQMREIYIPGMSLT